MKCYKAQVSMEFLTLAGLAFLFALFFVAAAAHQIREFRAQEEYLLIQEVAAQLQEEVALAVAVEDGYTRSFSLPDKLEGKVDYFIITSNSSVSINSSKTTVSLRIASVSGNFTKGTNLIEKINDQVYVNR